MCTVTQFVLAYKVKKTQVQRLLPKNFHLLRGVLRLNVEIMTDVPWLEGRDCIRVEFNTPVSHDDKRGWFNLVTWENCFIADSKERDIPVNTAAKVVVSVMKSETGSSFSLWNEKGDAPFLNMDFEKTGEMGGCPHEEDDEGTFYYSKINDVVKCYFKPKEEITSNKEYCNASAIWDTSLIPTVPRKYKHLPRICNITEEENLGGYTVTFDRTVPEDKYELIIGEE